MKKFKALSLSLFIVMCMATAVLAAYPEKNIQGIIQWGAGGGCDGVSRAITPLAEKYLGKTIILQNKTGATGAVATTMVANMPADGYTLLYAAENPAIYRVLGLSPLSFNDFEPIIIPVEGAVVICVNPETPYKTMKDLVEAAKKNSKIKMGTSGTGGLPYVAGAMMKNIHDIQFNMIQFDGDGPGATAVMGGHAEVMPLALSTSVEYIKGGRLRGLAVLRTERVPQLPDVPAITEIYPEYKQYLPWGPFYGVFVKKGTPKDVVAKLTEAFTKAYNEARFTEFVANSGGFKMGLTGQKAADFTKKFESTASWLIYNAGGAKKSPKDFNIPQPK
ncbi:tripartite tricarboxylate transporter substrate binding protein [Cloacibacillus porcorum]|uniref:Bug family tripartite tricarboxylate transporter substrate binding protein n=1 Tax=Cloacibacillus porcorum TaxID=1197717 RepID=UPI0023F48E23|nr:tripartite tricarboxylate transporter substrate binding protein [Cloacibacillus porcorum]MDD7650577.1 tripartite tricarboxylate transporter substrate binding protein [Cloacibacillus porcorum]MDY4095021.1 tripartite tricarboxylate transporter substrate binding protein [Cloacibacillus porcorum]